METILEMKNISKHFSGVKALDKIQFDLSKGEIHSLLGENGAGKSTMIKILAGIHTPTEGQIFINGKEVKIEKVSDAKELGISVIHQELSLVPYMTVAENIYLGRMPSKKSGFVDDRKLEADAYKVLERLGVQDVIHVNDYPANLTVAQQQMVEIARALSVDSKILIMDEPTASLTERETVQLLEFVQMLKNQGVAIIYISHRMDEVFQISDRITVFRDGQYIATRNIGEVTYDDVIRLMVGREMKDVYPEVNLTKGKELLRVEHLDDGKFLKDISFELHQGEILGFYGLVGSGRTEIMRYLFGVDKGAAYNAWLEGREFKVSNPKEAIEAGIILAPESRKEQGLVLIQDIRFNTVLAILDKLIHGVKTDKKQETEIVEKYMKKMRTKATSAAHITGQLSGGNQQKVVLAKCLATNPKILILDEPTRGIDVGAKFEIYKMITELAEEGVGIIFISSELPEILNLSTRVITMHEGQKTGELAREELSEELVLKYATGGANK